MFRATGNPPAKMKFCPLHMLSVRIIQAKNIKSRDLLTASDCYVRLWLPSASKGKLQTKTIKNSDNPVWNETFYFRIQREVENILELAVCDEDPVTKDDVQFTVLFNVARVRPGETIRETFALKSETERCTKKWESLEVEFWMERMQYRNIICLFQYEDDHLTNREKDMAETFNAFFASVFNTDDGPRGSQCPEPEGHDCEHDQLPADPETVWDLVLQLDPYKSMWPDGIHPRILKELSDGIAKPLLMIFKQCWESREVLDDCKLANVVLVFKKGKKEHPGNYKPVSLTSVPGKVMEKIILGSIEKHLKDNVVTGQSQHGLMRGKTCL
ncbi:hypothetical protein BTVI_79711 [Pitangus sulphuratus]|nr:hypothetical protein BTVI_79711 [Pitangus sulphuratus]